MLANGKSRAFVGNRPVTAGLLKELAPHLGRYPRPARSAAAFFPGGATGDARRVCGRGRVGRRGGIDLHAMARSDGGTRRIGSIGAGTASAGGFVVVSSDRRSKRWDPWPARIRSLKTSAACCATWSGWRRPRARRTQALYDAPESVTPRTARGVEAAGRFTSALILSIADVLADFAARLDCRGGSGARAAALSGEARSRSGTAGRSGIASGGARKTEA